MTWAFLPDTPPETPNTWRVCDGFHPDANGCYRTGFMAGGWSDYGASVAAFGRAYRTAAGDLGVLVVRPTTNMYVWNGTTWNDRKGAVLPQSYGPYATAQFGNITLTAGTSKIAARDATGASNFAEVSGAPNARLILVTPRNIVVAFNPIDRIAGGSPDDSWWTSDVGDYTNWTTGEAASGNLRQTPGPVTSAAVLGNDVIAFKARGVYRGQYVSGTVKWKWDLIDPALGAWGPGAAITVGGRVYFIGDDGVYSFDGSSFLRLDRGIGNTILQTIADPAGDFDALNSRAIQLVYDSINRRIAIFNFGLIDIAGTNEPSVNSPQHFTYHIDSGLWGYQSKVADVATDTLDKFSGIIVGAEEINNFTNGAWTFNSNIALLSATNTDIRFLTTEFSSGNCGVAYKPKLRTYRLGARDRMTTTTRLIPHWTKAEGAGTDLSGATVKSAIFYHSDSPMESETAGNTVTLSTDLYRADNLKTARFHSAELQINCEAVIDGATWKASDAGEE